MRSAGLWRGTVTQRVRLASGLVLFAFAATHFLNHALGLVSLDAVDTFDRWRTTVTHSPPGTVILVIALVGHVGSAIASLLARRSWHMPLWQWMQIALGILIPLQLLPHIVNTGVASAAFGVRVDYTYELARIWTATIVPQSLLLLAVWVHGCIGLHFWLRLLPRYRAVSPVLLSLAVLLPFAALAGVSVGGRTVRTELADPPRADAVRAEGHWPSETDAQTLRGIGTDARGAWTAGLAILGTVVWGTAVLARRRRRFEVRYVNGPAVRAEPGPTLLDISRRNNIPHTAVCGGRGRCSTCRVLVVENEGHLTAVGAAERRTLAAVGAGPHVRLACQACPTGSVTVLPLVPAVPRVAAALAAGEAEGVERDLAVLFVDLRGFTTLTEHRLPFDVIYLLSQFFSTVGEPIHTLGGWIANYAGDGLIALFSHADGPEPASRSALLAAAGIDRAMAGLNDRLQPELRQPLRIAMGLHAGAHVLGRVGFGAAQPMSVVGLAVNVASRLEALAKAEGVQLAVSRLVADHAGLDCAGLSSEPVDVRGVSEALEVVLVPRASDLLARLKGQAALPLDPALPA